MLLLFSDPNDTVTSNSFDVPVGCVMFDIVIIIGDVILNLVTLKQNHTKHLKKRFQSQSIDFVIYDIRHLIRVFCFQRKTRLFFFGFFLLLFYFFLTPSQLYISKSFNPISMKLSELL